ncbi:MAG: redoxin domain-containing protein [Chitinophagaceae bacterium]
MKIFLISLLLLPSVLFAQTALFAQTVSNNFTITGTVAGLPEGAEVKITSANDINTVLAKGAVKQGTFIIKGAVPEPGLYLLVLGAEQPQHIYLENKNITISGSQKDIKNIKINGSISHKDFEVFKNTFTPLMGELNVVAADINQTADVKKREALMKKHELLVNIIKTEVGNFVAAKRSSFVSPFLLFVTAQTYDDPLLTEQRFQILDSSIRNSQIGKNLYQFIQYNKVGAVGTNAIDFSQPDVNGKPVTLSSFKGKYVLLDFWASWCRPCREENPNVVKVYQKFSNKNFTVLGVSLDKEKEPWIKAIQKDGLTWTQVSDLQLWSNEVAVMYRVQGIPQNFLIDPNGKIIAKNLRGPELESKLCQFLGCN